MTKEGIAHSARMDIHDCIHEAGLDNSEEKQQADHPSLQREDVSKKALRDKFAPKDLKASFIIASSVVLAVINIWIFLAQFRPSAFVLIDTTFDQLILFQDVSFAFFLVALALPIVLNNIAVGIWFRIGIVLLSLVPLWSCLYMTALIAHVPHELLVAIFVINYALFGFSLGLAFCNWVRFFVHFSSDIPLQMGLAIILSALVCIGIYFIPEAVLKVVVILLPLFAMPAFFHLRSLISTRQDLSSLDIAEGPKPIKANEGLWISLSVVGLIYGCCFGFAISDYSTMNLCAFTCAIGMLVLGVIMIAYFLRTGKNFGYHIQASSLLALTAAAQGLLAIFERDCLPLTFSMIFAGEFLFAIVLLMQLPRVFNKMQSLKTFFALFFVFCGCQYLGSILRNFLIEDAPPLIFKIFSAVLLCLIITAMAFVLKDNSVSSVWGLLPLSEYPRKKYKRACEFIKTRFGLTPREMEIMSMVGRGRNGTFVQEKLVISKSTYQTHMRNLYKKLDIHSDQELIDIIESALNEPKKQEAFMSDKT